MTDTTTAADIFIALVGTLDRVGVDWSHDVSLATDGAPSLNRRKAGVGTKFRVKVQATNGGHDFWTFHCILHQEALCCKLLKMNNVMEVVVRTVNFIRSRGLNHRQFDSLLRENTTMACHTTPRGEIKQFMEKKGKPVLEFKSTEWMQDLAFMVDVTEHLNNLNNMLQGHSKVATQYYDSICAFKLKLSFVYASDLPINFQLEIIDLQCDSDLKGKLAAAGLDTFYQHLLPGYPNLTALAEKCCACLEPHIFVSKYSL
ncbi:general transcription factor II-I repeat domain-containing protein 2-like [Penaeus monodon]|uniref:general transcription factor II-I repeat domain-containing protein 2-like n=1 Tax=Penaeus monodon TaxID=6687 RepID=UPI0018A75B95|nr:general transcription factor II-I repeat domain-containing protein 2-like [Penaeus monodon]